MVYIKSISMDGFKSYGNKNITLYFPSGFTGIIGPNGSGKSNVVDAISFTLGEISSKSMRAKDLTDLIYSGTGGDKSAEMASVEIIFDNKDHKIPVPLEEVSVQREVKRKGGGSTYRFNGKRSTRQEIMDKLKIANIDVREGFNLVLQGRIAELAGMSPEKRREMIEDLAGTNEFDEKKIQAIDELEKAEIKLGEFDLLLNEAQTAVKKLEKEKKAVEEWEAIVKNIFEKKSILYSYRHSKFLKEIKSFQDGIDDLNKENETLENEKKEKSNELKEIQDSIQGVNNEIDKTQKELESTQTKISNNLSDSTGTKRDIKNGERRNKEMIREIELIRSKNDEIKGNQENISQQISELDKKIVEISAKKNEKEKEQNEISDLIKKSESKYNNLKVRSEELDKNIKSLEGKLNQIGLQRSMKESSVDIKEGQYLTKKRELEFRKRNMATLSEEITTVIEEIDQSRELLTVAEEKVTASESKKESYEKILDELEIKRTELERIHSSTKARIETIESFLSESANPVLNAIEEKSKKNEILGIVGRLGDIIETENLSTKEKAALIPYLNAIVVDSAVTAQECIAFLRDEQIGYGNFIPLEELNDIKKELEIPFEFINQLEGKFKPIANVFDDLIIVDSLRDAIDTFIRNIEENTNNKQILTISGEKISRDGIISGGSSSESNEMMISELNKKLIEQADQLNNVTQEYEANKIKHKRLIQLVTEVTKKSENVKQSIRNKEEKSFELQKRKDDDEFFIQRTDKEVESLKIEIDAGTTLIEGLKKEEEEFRSKLNSLIPERDEVLNEMEQINYNKLLEDIRKVEKVLSGLEIVFSKNEAIKNEKIHQKEVILQNQVKDNEKKIETLEKQIKDTQSELEKLNSDLQKFEDDLAAKRKDENSLKETIISLQDSISEKRRQIDSRRSEIGNINRKVERINQQISDLKVKQERSKTELNNIQAKIDEESIDLIEVKEAISERKIESQITDLLETKKSLEPVNALAIQQFHEANERFMELKERKDQITEERKVIVDFINKIEYEKKTVFLNIFNKIDKEFGRIFDMIAGGRAWLSLENPEEPFEGGVTITAEPRGKKVKSIQAMSGGEKSLTALALIFAMQKVDPSPFYVLDEVDAALDVMNVRRVAKVVQKMSEESQVIMITHRDIAMRYANNLYGVTNLKGISKVISVEISDEGALKSLSSE
ncbi:MAG: chromosome segregation protein SMC [Candidatus Lokiarchaeota archaeon]|nr:chromosome segregation protein SMC [Candidatus Lokiarchaeota archaeon]